MTKPVPAGKPKPPGVQTRRSTKSSAKKNSRVASDSTAAKKKSKNVSKQAPKQVQPAEVEISESEGEEGVQVDPVHE
ncbi:hypothetical protein FRB90_008818, partial [Tulasnella sp. 427]